MTVKIVQHRHPNALCLARHTLGVLKPRTAVLQPRLIEKQPLPAGVCAAIVIVRFIVRLATKLNTSMPGSILLAVYSK